MTWRPWEPGGAHYQPALVTAHLSEPIVYLDDMLHLDGPLSWGAYCELDPRTQRRMPPLSSDWVADLDLPLRQWRVTVADDWDGDERLLWQRPGRRGKASRTRDLWGWCASSEVVEWSSRGVAEVRKRPDTEAMARYTDAGSLQLGAGSLKAYDLKLPTVVAREVTWHAYGDLGAIERLLSHVPALGKKRGVGWGTVSRWTVEAEEIDRSVIAASGELARRMPSAIGIDGRPTIGAIRPPYFHRSREVESVEPC